MTWQLLLFVETRFDEKWKHPSSKANFTLEMNKDEWTSWPGSTAEAPWSKTSNTLRQRKGRAHHPSRYHAMQGGGVSSTTTYSRARPPPKKTLGVSHKANISLHPRLSFHHNNSSFFAFCVSINAFNPFSCVSVLRSNSRQTVLSCLGLCDQS